MLDVPDREEEEEQDLITKKFTKGKLTYQNKRDQDVSDSDEDDREYENNQMKRFNFR